MKIEKISIDKIKPYEKNAKLHPVDQIEQIKKSIEKFGNNDPIAVDENNIIIEGHGRYKALKQLGINEVEIIRLSHLNEEQKKAYALVHNKLTMNTGFDLELLTEEIDSILDIDMSDFNFFDTEPLEITKDYENEEDTTGESQLYLKYKNKYIPVSESEERQLDNLIGNTAQ